MRTLIALLISTTAATAGEQCMPRETFLQIISDRFGETRRSLALGPGDETVVEMYANEETGSWTFAATDTNGKTCVVVSGDSYFATTDALPTPGQDM